MIEAPLPVLGIMGTNVINALAVSPCVHFLDNLQLPAASPSIPLWGPHQVCSTPHHHLSLSLRNKQPAVLYEPETASPHVKFSKYKVIVIIWKPFEAIYQKVKFMVGNKSVSLLGLRGIKKKRGMSSQTILPIIQIFKILVCVLLSG